MLIGGVEYDVARMDTHYSMLSSLPFRLLVLFFLPMLIPIRVFFPGRELRPVVPARLRIMG